MKEYRLTRNPYLLFLPFLLFLIVFALLNQTGGHGDEGRYLMFAKNLVHGFYSPPPPNVDLTNGPGYPIIILPLMLLGLSKIYVILLNPFFYYFSIVLLYKALLKVVSYKTTLFFSFFWACYYLGYQNVILVATEPLTFLLVSLLTYSLVNLFQATDQKQIIKYIILGGFAFGYLVLTKIAFIYVLFAMLIGSVVLWAFYRKKSAYKKLSFLTITGFVTILPYLVYAYVLTGRMFYWNTNTGDSLYWMSTPYADEYGDWKGYNLHQEPIDFSGFNIPGTESTLIAHHQKDFNLLGQYSGYSKDSVFKAIAIRNIKTHPLKYLQNCFYNVGRLVFHYPFSMAVQRPKVLLVFPINGIILTLMLFSLIPTFLNWRKLSVPLRFLLIFTFLYLGMSTLVTALVRMFTVIVPILVFWFAIIFERSVKINLRFHSK